MSDDIHFQITEDDDTITVHYKGVTFTWFTQLEIDDMPNYIWAKDWMKAQGYAEWPLVEMPTAEAMQKYVTHITAKQLGGEL